MNNNDFDNIDNNLNDSIIDETELNSMQTTLIENQDFNIRNNNLSLENQEQKLLEENMRKAEERKALILKEKQEKEHQKRQKRRKAGKIAFKSGVAVSCFLCLGVGLGVGNVVSQSIISQREQTSFKFDASNIAESENSLIYTSASASSLYKEVGDSVVNISTKVSGGFFSPELQDYGSGSGIIYKVDGDKVYIITNNHVIEGAQYVSISVTGEEQVEASLVGTDPSSDLAVLSVSKQALNNAGIKNITTAKFANSDDVQVGDFVFPIGNALGRGKTMTQGMISAENKEINIDGKNLTVIQTDAAINPGNSGGALMNTKGEVVGVNTAKLSSSAIEGIGYAIPSNIVLDIANQIIENGYVERPYFGIMGKTITEQTKKIYGLNFDGVLVVEVEEGSNAEKSGLKASDIITSFNGQEIASVEDLSNAIKKCKVNDTVSFDIIRNGVEKVTLKVTLTSSNTTF